MRAHKKFGAASTTVGFSLEKARVHGQRPPREKQGAWPRSASAEVGSKWLCAAADSTHRASAVQGVITAESTCLKNKSRDFEQVLLLLAVSKGCRYGAHLISRSFTIPRLQATRLEEKKHYSRRLTSFNYMLLHPLAAVARLLSLGAKSARHMPPQNPTRTCSPPIKKSPLVVPFPFPDNSRPQVN